jgi:hypothetical protein
MSAPCCTPEQANNLALDYMNPYVPKRNMKSSHETISFTVGLQLQSDFKCLKIIMTGLSQRCYCWIDAAIVKLLCYHEFMCFMLLSSANRTAKIILK